MSFIFIVTNDQPDNMVPRQSPLAFKKPMKAVLYIMEEAGFKSDINGNAIDASQAAKALRHGQRIKFYGSMGKQWSYEITPTFLME